MKIFSCLGAVAGLGACVLAGAAHAALRVPADVPPLSSHALVAWDDDSDWDRRGWGEEHEDWDRGYGRPGGCDQARAKLNQANAALNVARYNLTVLDRLCGGGDLGCVAMYQNVYNQAVNGVRRAQKGVRFRCGY